MNMPPQMRFVCGPGPLWETITDLLVEKVQEHEGRYACPPWPGDCRCPPWPGDCRCPLKPDETCPGETACWVWWAYTLAVARMATESARQANDLQGKG